jgi:hypothetical protein
MRKRLSITTRNRIVVVADAVARVKDDEEFPPSRRPSILSTLTKLPKWANKLRTGGIKFTSGNMPFTKLSVEGLFNRATPAVLGISEKRMANARSECRFVMEHYGWARERIRVTLSPRVQAIARKLSKFERLAMGQLLVFMTVLDIDPADMSDQLAEDFRAWLIRNEMKNSDATWRRSLVAWNKSGLNSNIKLTIPKRRARWGLPWSAFPPTLEEEVDRFFAQRGSYS